MINPHLYHQVFNYFTNTCSKCHGTYSDDGKYPNLLILTSIIPTDSILYLCNQQNLRFIDWFNKSWFAQGETSTRLEPYKGYIAPLLDGVWITAPAYLYNGSVPTVQAQRKTTISEAKF